MSPGLFKVWIQPLKADELEGELLLMAPNDFVANWVRDRLMTAICEAATSALGVCPKVRIIAEPSYQGALTVPPSPDQIQQAGSRPKVSSRTRIQGQLGLPGTNDGAQARQPAWRFSFEDFVVGPCNELAYAATKGMCYDSIPSDQLFISSGAGLGKTHLMQAVGKHLTALSNKKRARLEYLTGEEFARQMIFALRAKEIERFKARFRDSVDILLLEDIHFFQGKQKIQDELLATLKSLQANGSKVVLSSSFLPRELKDLDPQLASRFCSGFIAMMTAPDYDTRKRILERKAKSLHIVLPTPVTDLLANKICNDVRQLESCLQNLILKAKLLNRQISTDLAWQVIDQYKTEETHLNIERIIEFVCDCFELAEKQLSSKSRQRQIVLARNTAFYLARKYTELSLQDIGARFNRRHSTVIKGITNVERELSQETPLGRQLANTMEMIKRYSTNSEGVQTIPASPAAPANLQ